MDKQEYIKKTVGIVVEKVASVVRLSDLGGFTVVRIESGHPDANHGDLCKWISGLLSAAYDQGAASKDTVSTESPALALAEERCKALEEKIKEQDKALAKIADLIDLDERSRTFQIIDRVRMRATCQKTMDEYLNRIAETVGLPKNSTWASVARRISEVCGAASSVDDDPYSIDERRAELLAILGQPEGGDWDLVAKAARNVVALWKSANAELENLRKSSSADLDGARQQGFDEAVAIVDRCIEVDEEGIEKAKARVDCLKNIAGAMRNAVLCDDE